MNSRKCIFLFLIACFLQFNGVAGQRKDVYKTSNGKLKIELHGHASILLKYNKISLYCDPVIGEDNTKSLPTADVICITHPHYDHLDINSINNLTNHSTQLIYPESASNKLHNGFIMKSGEQINIHNITIEAIPAYNIKNKYNSNEAYHPIGFGLGYLIHFDELTVYVAGDTDFIPEMYNLPDIDIAILPIMAPYTMGKEMFAKAVEILKPKHIYPYHNGNTDLEKLEEKIIKDYNIDIKILL